MWVREVLFAVACPDDNNSSFCETAGHFYKAAHKNVIFEMCGVYRAVLQWNRGELTVL
jgi:predicted nucleotide-binding protein